MAYSIKQTCTHCGRDTRVESTTLKKYRRCAHCDKPFQAERRGKKTQPPS
jgi:hypothetical protein